MSHLQFSLIFCCLFSVSFQLDLLKSRNSHQANELSVPQIRYLAKLSNTSHLNEVLDNILIPRVVGTPNHDKVHNYITEQLRRHGWTVEIDSFEDRTPLFGVLTFRNIIGTLNPNADRYLVLACHYDSKYFKDEDFLGATDSAVPCAMMLNLIHVMDKELQDVKSDQNLSLKLVFFDGEEAFVNWGPNDSIYGAKHLAKKLQQSRRPSSSGELATDLNRFEVLVLLDLIGTPDPSFYSFFGNTEKWYLRLVRAEHRLANMGQLTKYSDYQSYFKKRSSPSFVEDDHVPFMQKGVPILHLIPHPFPDVWHTMKDDRSAIDMNTVENINKVLRVFVAEYLHLSV